MLNIRNLQRAAADPARAFTALVTRSRTTLSLTWRRLRLIFVPQIKLNSFPDYESYRRLQQEGNERKLHLVYAREQIIVDIARYAERRLGRVNSVLCHGTRNGTELKWFKNALSGHSTVLGTEISSTATQFPDTIQWDFHDMKPEWEGAWDVIYTNSWDHAFDPKRAFRTWLRCLSPKGLLFLEHSKNHEPTVVNNLDPFGATLNGLVHFVNGLEPETHQVVDVIVDLPNAKGRSVVVVGS
jgi:hypothetical protein